MKTISYVDKLGGTWPSFTSIRHGIDFRRIRQEADALESVLHSTVVITLNDNDKTEDITEWVNKKAAN